MALVEPTTIAQLHRQGCRLFLALSLESGGSRDSCSDSTDAQQSICVSDPFDLRTLRNRLVPPTTGGDVGMSESPPLPDSSNYVRQRGESVIARSSSLLM